MGGWLETDNRAILVQLDLTGTLTGTELGNSLISDIGLLGQGAAMKSSEGLVEGLTGQRFDSWLRKLR